MARRNCDVHKSLIAIHSGANSITEAMGSHKTVDDSVLLPGDRRAFRSRQYGSSKPIAMVNISVSASLHPLPSLRAVCHSSLISHLRRRRRNAERKHTTRRHINTATMAQIERRRYGPHRSEGPSVAGRLRKAQRVIHILRQRPRYIRDDRNPGIERGSPLIAQR